MYGFHGGTVVLKLGFDRQGTFLIDGNTEKRKIKNTKVGES